MTKREGRAIPIWLKSALALVGVAGSCWAYPQHAVPVFLALVVVYLVYLDRDGQIDRQLRRKDREIAELRAVASVALAKRCDEARCQAEGRGERISLEPAALKVAGILADFIRLKAPEVTK